MEREETKRKKWKKHFKINQDMCIIIAKYENIPLENFEGARIIQKILSQERNDVACSLKEDEK